MITGQDCSEINDIKYSLNKRFQISNLGPVSFYLGITITRDYLNYILYLGQKVYITKILQDFGIANYNPSVFPIDPSGVYLILAPKDYLASAV